MGVFGKEGGRGERETRGGEAQEGHQKVISGGTKKKRGGNYRKPKKRPLKKPRTRKSLKKKKDGKKIMKKPLLTTCLCRKNPLFFHFIVVPALSPFPLAPSPSLSPSMSCLLVFRPVLFSFSPSLCPSPRNGHSPFPHLPTSLPPPPLTPLMLYYTILYHHTRYSVLFYYTYHAWRPREKEKCLYVSNRIDSVMGKKKDQTNRVLFFSIFPFFPFHLFIRTFFF